MQCKGIRGILKVQAGCRLTMVTYEEQTAKQEKCHLSGANGIDEWCTRGRCIFWRLLDEQDADTSNMVGCGLRHSGYLNDLPAETSSWLLNMKKVLEDTKPEVLKSRIIFRRRERK